jgi:hypothetical protein
MGAPVSNEVAAALGRFFFAGAGPSHSVLTRVFTAAGYRDVDPFDPVTKTPNKEQRVVTVVSASVRHPAGARKLMDELLNALRIARCFEQGASDEAAVKTLTQALAHIGWALTADGRLQVQGDIDLETGGREALDEQIERLRRNTDDPGLLLGSAKDLLESISKFVLEEAGRLPPGKLDFHQVLHLAFEQLGMLPAVIATGVPGAKQLRAIYQSAKTTAEQVAELRNLQGTGHGRTLPTGVSPSAGRFVIREATHVAELLLSTHDHQMGR